MKTYLARVKDFKLTQPGRLWVLRVGVGGLIGSGLVRSKHKASHLITESGRIIGTVVYTLQKPESRCSVPRLMSLIRNTQTCRDDDRGHTIMRDSNMSYAITDNIVSIYDCSVYCINADCGAQDQAPRRVDIDEGLKSSISSKPRYYPAWKAHCEYSSFNNERGCATKCCSSLINHILLRSLISLHTVLRLSRDMSRVLCPGGLVASIIPRGPAATQPSLENHKVAHMVEARKVSGLARVPKIWYGEPGNKAHIVSDDDYCQLPRQGLHHTSWLNALAGMLPYLQ